MRVVLSAFSNILSLFAGWLARRCEGDLIHVEIDTGLVVFGQDA